jgi:hypothetical protein
MARGAWSGAAVLPAALAAACALGAGCGGSPEAANGGAAP